MRFSAEARSLPTTGATPIDRWIGRRDTRSFSPGRLPGTDEIVPIALRLFEEKKRKLEAAIGPDTALHAKKWAFLRSVLTNQDLAQNPELVDFALSDGLLSLVTNYLGTIPHLNRVDLLYSVSHGGEEAISSQIYHLDPEGRRQAKLFLNLQGHRPRRGAVHLHSRVGEHANHQGHQGSPLRRPR